jgi:hypothetical protein
MRHSSACLLFGVCGLGQAVRLPRQPAGEAAMELLRGWKGGEEGFVVIMIIIFYHWLVSLYRSILFSNVGRYSRDRT